MPRRWSRALEALEATIALTKDVPEDVLALGRRAAELSDDVQFLHARRRSRARLLPRHPRPRRVPARLADRRVRHHPRDAARPDDGDGAHLGHAQRRRPVRLRPRPPRRPPGARSAAAVGVRLHASRRSSTCRRRCPTRGRRTSSARPDARSSRSSSARAGRAFVLFTSYANLRAGAPARRRPRSTTRSWSRARRRGRRCCASSRPRRTPCSSPPPASGRASTSSASR